MNSMFQVPAVVVGVDGTERSLGAIRYGVAQARQRGCAVQLVHVEPSYLPMAPMLPLYAGDVESVVKEVLEEARRQVHALDPEQVVVTTGAIGATAHEIVKAAQHAQLIVVGHDTREGVDKWLHGATAVRVASQSGCPTVVVPQTWTPDEQVLGRIVVGLRDITHANEVLAHSFAEADTRGATLVVVHAWHLPDPYLNRIEARTHADEWVAEGKELVKTALTGWRQAYPGVPVEVRIEHGSPAAVLAHAAEGADLVVLVRHATPLHHAGHLGSTARALLLGSGRPVVVYPAGSAATEPQRVLEESGALPR